LLNDVIAATNDKQGGSLRDRLGLIKHDICRVAVEIVLPDRHLVVWHIPSDEPSPELPHVGCRRKGIPLRQISLSVIAFCNSVAVHYMDRSLGLWHVDLII
jgi:hypothetical protein